MALIIPPPAFAYCTTNLSGTPDSTGTKGTGVSSGTSNGVGTTTAVLSAITHDVELLAISFTNTSTASAVNRLLCDVFIDPAGGTTWDSTPIIPNLVCGGAGGNNAIVLPAQRYLFPIWIKSGASIGVRTRYAHSSLVASRVYVQAWGGHSRPAQWWCGQAVYDIGTSTAASSGTSHTAGNSGAYSSWTDFGSTTTAAAGAVAWGVQPQLSAMSSLGYYFEFGAAGTRIGSPIYCCTNVNEQIGIFTGEALTFASIPAGTQLQARGTCSGTAEAMDVAAYIVA